MRGIGPRKPLWIQALLSSVAISESLPGNRQPLFGVQKEKCLGKESTC
jgi:hypothetical protein